MYEAHLWAPVLQVQDLLLEVGESQRSNIARTLGLCCAYVLLRNAGEPRVSGVGGDFHLFSHADTRICGKTREVAQRVCLAFLGAGQTNESNQTVEHTTTANTRLTRLQLLQEHEKLGSDSIHSCGHGQRLFLGLLFC